MMETSISTPTQKYAAAALFALALHRSQIHQTRPCTSNPLPPLDEEPIGSATIAKTNSVSDNPELWIHQNSGLLFNVFRLLGVDDKAWDGLKETAGSSSQVRHHVGSFLTLLSEEKDGKVSERVDKELALAKTVDATALSMGNLSVSSPEAGRTAEESTDETTERTPPKKSTQENVVDEGNCLSYRRKVTVLYELLSACVADDPETGKKSNQRKKGYDARHRVALRLLASWLDIEWMEMEAMEIMVAHSMMALVRTEGGNTISEGFMDKCKRAGTVGAAALAGGTLMAITGGLAAPAIANGLGALVPALGTVAGSAAVAASFGAAGAGLTGYKMARRVGSIDEFEFKEITKNHNQGWLAVGIFVSGFVLKDEDFTMPWEDLNYNLERYAVQWESKKLIELSTAIKDWLTSSITLEMMREGAMLTVLSTLITALALPATLVTAANLIDSKWAVAIDRSEQAGKLLAEVLLKGLQGNRPVTLVGFSLGARVIFKCLQCLAEAREGNAGLVERVVLLGAPVSIKDENWEAVRKMVAGRFVNAYSTHDWTLGVVFRASLLSQGLAGIQPVGSPGVENVDVSQLIDGHSSYLHMTKQILEQLELENYYPCFRTRDEKKSTSWF